MVSSSEIDWNCGAPDGALFYTLAPQQLSTVGKRK
jgi:hypothetical protein